MAVVFTQDSLFYSPIPAADRRYPIRRWTSFQSVVGDASGGIITLNQQFRTSNLSGLIYSLEYFEFTSNGSVGSVGNADLTFFFFNRFTTTTPTASGYTFIPTTGVSGEQFMLPEELLRHPIILGTKLTTVATIRTRFATNRNGQTYQMYLWGYLWRPSSFLDGGLLRPGDYPYPAKLP